MKALVFWLAATIVLTMPSTGSAGPDRITFLLGSNHVNATRDFQEFNPGVFLTWDYGFNYSAGLYYNSYERVSPLVSVGYDWELFENLNAGGFFALAVYPGDGDEFRHSLGDVVPLLGLQARYKNIFMQFLPADGETLDALITFGLTFDLD